MIAYLGASLGYLVTGVVIVEATYDIPGLGNLILDSLARRDCATVVGGVLVISVLVILRRHGRRHRGGDLDPRIRIEGDRPH